MARRVLVVLILVLLVGGAGFLALAWKPAIAPVTPPARSAFDAGLVARGADLALLGNCNVCHTREGGAAYAGGKPVATPFGAIHATNITPDPETGIGSWSEAAFVRSMREGVDREGRHLYPAFPYDHYTRVTDTDLQALYAFLMTRAPVRAEAPPNNLAFPFNLRPLLAGWKLLFLDEGPVAPDPARSAEVNRGAYLAEGLGHCGACHTPRNVLGAEVSSRHFDGGEAEDWWGPPLNATSPAPVPWTADSLLAYLRGWELRHGGAVGPMAPVVHNLSQVPEADVRAIAVYVAALMGPPSAERLRRTEAITDERNVPAAPSPADPNIERGRIIYAGACAVCHESGGQVPYTVRSLAWHTVLVAPDPRNVIRVVREGVHPPEGAVGAIMPPFAGSLTDAQLADLVRYLRARFSDAPSWPDVEAVVQRIGREDSGREGGG